MEDKVDVIRCKDCKHAHENNILWDDYVACRFIESFPIRVDKNGFCYRAEPKETNRACGACRHFEYYEHMIISGIRFEGICRGFGNHIYCANSFDCKNCNAFEPAEIKAPHVN